MNRLECAGIYLPAHSWNKRFFFLTNKTEINSYQMMMRREKYWEEEETVSWMPAMSLVRDSKGNISRAFVSAVESGSLLFVDDVAAVGRNQVNLGVDWSLSTFTTKTEIDGCTQCKWFCRLQIKPKASRQKLDINSGTVVASFKVAEVERHTSLMLLLA